MSSLLSDNLLDQNLLLSTVEFDLLSLGIGYLKSGVLVQEVGQLPNIHVIENGVGTVRSSLLLLLLCLLLSNQGRKLLLMLDLGLKGVDGLSSRLNKLFLHGLGSFHLSYFFLLLFLRLLTPIVRDGKLFGWIVLE